ncbi:MAG: hypothetical protein AMJ90_05855 [candidate division Zixibacteria bacterium SM23_73_2]|nr:MAG: hypothetical protein AMJ90_05855 [candidate division Zixibacteria bacterium SM23_73_2]
MRVVAAIIAVLTLFLWVSSLTMAANTANQTVTFEVTAINEVSVSGDPGDLEVNTATAGSEPTADTDATTTWALTTNQSTKKMTGSIDEAMPANVTLQVNLTAPTAGGSSQGDVTLTTSDADLVTSIATVAESGLTITYTLSATVDAGVVAQDTRTVTLTLTDG